MNEMVKVYTRYDTIPNCIKENFINLPAYKDTYYWEDSSLGCRTFNIQRIEDGLEGVRFAHFLESN